MKKGIFKELLYLRINGGNLNDESSVQRVDIDAYLPIAVNWAVQSARNSSLDAQGNRDLPSVFYGVFENVEIKRDKQPPYIEVPKGYIPLYGNEGIRFVYDNCRDYYTPLNDADRRTISHYQGILTDQKYFYPVREILELYGVNKVAKTLSGEYIVDVSELSDDDELPIPAGYENDAINMSYSWISGERELPSDKKNNNADINVS